MATVFEFTLASENLFPNKKVDLGRFEKEIRASAITVALDSVAVVGGNCVVTFKANLSAAEEAVLGPLVQAHSGVALIPDVQAVELYAANGLPQPQAADGKPFTLPNIFPGEVLLNFTGYADSDVARFGGDPLSLQQVGAGTATQDVLFKDGVFLAGGHVEWDGGAWGANVYMELVAPPSTTKAPAVANQGNCNKVPTGLGFNIIVPAAGNGVYDLDVGVPVPANNDETMVQTGYWSHSEPWIGYGALTPGVPGSAKYNLFDVELDLAHFAKLHLFRDTGARDLIAPAIKPKWILPEWKMRIAITNVDANKTLRFAADLMIARRKSV
jgi:hypothetical protein